MSGINNFPSIMFVLLMLVAHSSFAAELNSSAQVIDQDPAWLAKVNSAYHRKKNLPATSDTRVIFDEDIAWALSRSNTDKIINDIAAAGFNVYVPCVWHGAGTYFFSDYAHLNSQLKRRKLVGDDPLEYLIKKAHEHNIEVHAWFTVVRRDENYYQKYFDGSSPEFAFNVHDEDFRKFITYLINDATLRYDLDGINLDYIRSMGLCNSKFCEDDYFKKMHRNLTEDLLVEKVSTKKIGSSAQEAIKNWNRFSVESIVKSISDFKNQYKPSVILSVDSVPRHYDFLIQGQDSLAWLSQGLIDHIFYMAYENEINYQKMDQIIFELGRSKDITPLIAFYDLKTLQKKSGNLLNRLLSGERRLWPDSGVAFYHYKQMSKDQIIKLKEDSFSQPACPAWRDCKIHLNN